MDNKENYAFPIMELGDIEITHPETRVVYASEANEGKRKSKRFRILILKSPPYPSANERAGRGRFQKRTLL